MSVDCQNSVIAHLTEESLRLNNLAEFHRKSAKLFAIIPIVLITTFFMFSLPYLELVQKVFTIEVLLCFSGIYIISLLICAGLYRTHIKEASRTESARLSMQRLILVRDGEDNNNSRREAIRTALLKNLFKDESDQLVDNSWEILKEHPFYELLQNITRKAEIKFTK